MCARGIAPNCSCPVFCFYFILFSVIIPPIFNLRELNPTPNRQRNGLFACWLYHYSRSSKTTYWLVTDLTVWRADLLPPRFAHKPPRLKLEIGALLLLSFLAYHERSNYILSDLTLIEFIPTNYLQNLVPVCFSLSSLLRLDFWACNLVFFTFRPRRG